VAGGAAWRSAAGHAAKAGTNTSGAGGLYPSDACGLIVLYKSTLERPQVSAKFFIAFIRGLDA
jgi:hypothetical protein